MTTNRRTFLRTIGAGSIGVTTGALFSGKAAAATVITLKGAGPDIWDDHDDFHYFYQKVSGDFDVVVNNFYTEPTSGWAKSGIMARTSLDPDAKNIMIRRAGGDASLQWRPETGGDTKMTDSAAWFAADWLRLTREGDTLNAYASQTEGDWRTLMPSGGRFTQDSIDLPDEIYLGLAVSSNIQGTLCTAKFKELSGDISIDQMTNRDIGNNGADGSVSITRGVPFVSTSEAADVGSTSATLQGSIDDMGQADSAEAYFEYREAGADAWSETDKQTFSSTGSYSQTVSGLSRGVQEYEFRAVMDTSDGDSAVGSVGVFSTSSIVAVDSVEDIETTSATLRGTLKTVSAGPADVYFEYRKVPTAEWATTEAETLSSTGSFSHSLSDLTQRRYYQVRAVAETADGATVRSPISAFSTSSPAATRPDDAGSPDHAGPESKSYFEPDDGFAEAAPWLDDETPIVKITEPTRGQLERSDVDGERLIVFETSGTVDLDGNLSIENDKMYLAGQTAPSPGITFIRGGLYIEASDCVVQHIRARAGDAGKGLDSDWEPDSLHTGDDTENNVIDHCSASWGLDETLSVGFQTADTTVTNCLISEALWHTATSPNPHGRGSIGAGNNAKNISWMGNAWSNNVSRNPRLDGETAIVNNIVHHVEEAANLDPEAISSIVGNGFLNLVDEGVKGDPVIANGHVYLEDNYTKPEVNVLAEVGERLDSPTVWPDGLEALASEEVFDHTLENVGARPADRTPQDERMVQDIRQGNGQWIDSQEEVGGYPDLAVNTRELDVPNGATRIWVRAKAREVETTES